MHEKSFNRGQSYIRRLTHLDGAPLLNVLPQRTAKAADQLSETLSPEQKRAVQAVAVDITAAFMQTIKEHLPEAGILHHRFHISSYFNEAVHKVRCGEHKELMAQGDETHNGTPQLWLYHPENFSPQLMEQFSPLKDLQLKVASA